MSWAGRHMSKILHLSFKTWCDKSWTVTFLQLNVPLSWHDCMIQDLASQVLTPFGLKIFHMRPFPRLISFMTWSSKTWIQLDLFSSLGSHHSSDSFVFKTWHICNSMSPSLDNDCSIQDLVFQVLNFFWANNFNSRYLPKTKYSVMKKTWQSHVWFFMAWHGKHGTVTYFATPCYTFKHGKWLHNSRLSFPSLDVCRDSLVGVKTNQH